MMATIEGSPSTTQSAYTSAANSTAIRMPITYKSLLRERTVTEILPTAHDRQSDASIAVAAARAAAQAAEHARLNAPLRRRAKSVSADLVTDADAAAEAAAAALLARHRPGDAVVGEEGADRAGARGRRWWIDAIDGTVGFAAGIPGAWCSAIALEDDDGPLASAILNPAGELFTAVRGEGAALNDAPTRIGAGVALEHAHIAVFLRQDRLVKPGVRESAHRLLDAAGLIRHAGPGSLELAWVAAGRLDAWVQPETDPWDWLPGALLVTESGGEARTVHAGTRWHLAGPPGLLDEIERLLV
jgi:myo-inositol-1(or 4)-monophosphatase